MCYHLLQLSFLFFSLTLFHQSSQFKYSDDSVQIKDFRPTYSNQYVCTYKKLDPDVTYYIREFEPADPNGAAHHILLYGCGKPGIADKDVWECGEMSSSSHEGDLKSGPICDQKSANTILFAEAMQAGSYKLPPDVSFKVGKESKYPYLVIQIHYKDADEFNKNPELTDNSGIKFKYQTEPTTLSAGVILLGSGGAVFPNSWTNQGVEALDIFCPPWYLNRRQPVVPFAYRTHAHSYGLLISGFRVQDQGPMETSWDLIGRMSPQLEQTFYPVETDIVIEPEDTLTARCLYSNPTDHVVQIGVTADDEMCNFYLMYYTLDGSDLEGDSTCFSTGLNSWSDEMYPYQVPEWVQELSMKLSKDEEMVVDNAMKSKMSMHGH